ncbi:MAG: hypothetical protein AAF555_02230 [Verrucomicrobiota bacterium]
MSLPIKDILTFAAFRPEPLDRGATWASRFPKHNSVLVNLNKSSVNWRIRQKNGNILDGGTVEGDLAEAIATAGDEWKDATQGGVIGLSINNRFMIALETNLSRKQGYREFLRTNPKSVLGSKYERGKRYAIEHHPELNSSLLLAVDEGLVKDMEEQLHKADLKAGRISCGLFRMLSESALEVTDSGAGGKGAAANSLLVVCYQGSACVLKMQGGTWEELRSRSGIYEDGDSEPVVSLVEPMIDASASTVDVMIYSDFPQQLVGDQLQQTRPNARVREASADGLFWDLIGNH